LEVNLMKGANRIAFGKYLIAALCLVVWSGALGFAEESEDAFVFSGAKEWITDFYGVGIWSEHALESSWQDPSGAVKLTRLSLMNLELSASSTNSDVFDSALSNGSVRDELGWTLTKTLLNAGWNLIDTSFVAYFRFDL
jgi:hypothetical protein